MNTKITITLTSEKRDGWRNLAKRLGYFDSTGRPRWTALVDYAVRELAERKGIPLFGEKETP